MDCRIGAPRFTLGHDLHLVAEQDDGVEVEGRVRLRPGREIELVVLQGSRGREHVLRAMVWSWRVVVAGNAGVVFRGFCRWV
jgi:hypothetical protein